MEGQELADTEDARLVKSPLEQIQRDRDTARGRAKPGWEAPGGPGLEEQTPGLAPGAAPPRAGPRAGSQLPPCAGGEGRSTLSFVPEEAA